MRDSFEQAKSRRHLTANVENKWFSNLYENVNSADPRNANTFSGIWPEPRKRPLPKPLSLDVFCVQMALHIFANPDKPSYTFTHPDMLPQTFPSTD